MAAAAEPTGTGAGAGAGTGASCRLLGVAEDELEAIVERLRKA